LNPKLEQQKSQEDLITSSVIYHLFFATCCGLSG